MCFSLSSFWNQIGGNNGLVQKLRSSQKVSSDLTLLVGYPGNSRRPQRAIGKVTSYLYTFSFGTNHRRLPKIRTVLEMIEECLSDTILRILIAAATTAMIVGTYQNPDHGWIEGLSIYFAIVIIISVTTTNDYIKEKQFQKLVDKANDTTCFVTRNQETKEISAEDLLVGDLVKIVPGMSVPADCIL